MTQEAEAEKRRSDERTRNARVIRADRVIENQGFFASPTSLKDSRYVARNEHVFSRFF